MHLPAALRHRIAHLPTFEALLQALPPCAECGEPGFREYERTPPHCKVICDACHRRSVHADDLPYAETLRELLRGERVTVEAFLASMEQCSSCESAPATHCIESEATGRFYGCDDHRSPGAVDLPYASALRALLAAGSWLDAIRARVVSPLLSVGPWVCHDPSPGDTRTIRVGHHDGVTLLCEGCHGTRADVELAAHARLDLPAMLAVLDALPTCDAEPFRGSEAATGKRSAIATKEEVGGLGRWCDEHAPRWSRVHDLPYAPALRVLQARSGQ